MSSGITKTTCPYCGVGCGVEVTAAGEVAGDMDHPANLGRLCSKGAALGETLAADGRLLFPELDGRQVSWDAALDSLASGFAATVRDHGPDATALYVSGQFLTEDYYVANKLMKGFIGTANIDTNSRLCMSSSVAGHVRAFGEDVVPGCYEDIDEVDLAVLVGSNMAWCHPVLFRRLAAARERRGTRVVVIDPRRTQTCDIADIHLPLAPGSDVALFAGLLGSLADKGVCDETWCGKFAAGFEETVAAARDTAQSPAAVAALTGLPVEDIERFYAWFADTERTITFYSQGVNQSTSGTDKVNAIINCHLAAGRIGRPGMGPFSLTGQPNAMGGREVGGLANQLAAHMHFNRRDDIDRVRRFWNAPRVATEPGLKAVDMFDAVLEGRVKALWIMNTNPAASMPRANRVKAALAACPFVAVSDCWQTDTTAFADLVLPAAGWSEKDGTVTNSERRISRQRALRKPPGEARPDWWMLSEVAKRMGFGDAFAYETPATIFREHCALSAFENEGSSRRVFNIGALQSLSDTGYEELPPLQWPLTIGIDKVITPQARLFGEGLGFPTPSGRARFVPTPFKPLASVPSTQWPFLLNTGRLRDQWHTMTRTGRLPRLMAHQSEPALEMNPADAQRLAVRDGGLVHVESVHGATILPARLSDQLREGQMFAPIHWRGQFTSAGAIAQVVSAEVDPVSGQPEMKATPVRVTAVAAQWHALLLTASERMSSGPFYWARVPLQRGHVINLAGWEPLPEGAGLDLWASALLNTSATAELAVYADPASSTFRYGTVVGKRLDACLFIARDVAALPPRDFLTALFATPLDPQARAFLLSGLSPSGNLNADRGRTICSCFGVGLRTLHDAIAAGNLTTVGEVGRQLRAGTNCGSCIPELKAILRAAIPHAA